MRSLQLWVFETPPTGSKRLLDTQRSKDEISIDFSSWQIWQANITYMYIHLDDFSTDGCGSTEVPPEIPDEAMNFMQQCLIKDWKLVTPGCLAIRYIPRLCWLPVTSTPSTSH